MADFEVVFYEKVNGDCPVEEFMESLDNKMKAKIVGMLELLEEMGNRPDEPYSKSIEDGILNSGAELGLMQRGSCISFILMEKSF